MSSKQRSRIEYNGTVAQWEALPKHFEFNDTPWGRDTAKYTVYCTDGTFVKGGY